MLHSVGQAQELLTQLPSRLQLCPHKIKSPQSQQHREELRSLALPAQLPGPSIGFFHFRGRIAFGRHQGRGEGGLQQQLLLSALRGVRQGPEQLQGGGEVTDRFCMG